MKHNKKIYTRSDSKLFGGGLAPVSVELFIDESEKYIGEALIVIKKKGFTSYNKILKFDYSSAKQFYNSLQ